MARKARRGVSPRVQGWRLCPRRCHRAIRTLCESHASSLLAASACVVRSFPWLTLGTTVNSRGQWRFTERRATAWPRSERTQPGYATAYRNARSAYASSQTDRCSDAHSSALRICTRRCVAALLTSGEDRATHRPTPRMRLLEHTVLRWTAARCRCMYNRRSASRPAAP